MRYQILRTGRAFLTVAFVSIAFLSVSVDVPQKLPKSRTAAAPKFCTPDRLWLLPTELLHITVCPNTTGTAFTANVGAFLPKLFRYDRFKIPFDIYIVLFPVIDSLLCQVSVAMGLVVADTSLIGRVFYDSSNAVNFP